MLDCVVDQKVRGIIFEAILILSEPNQNIQDYPECNSFTFQDNPENVCREYVEMEWQIENHGKKIKKLETDGGDFAHYIRKNNVEITRYFQKLPDIFKDDVLEDKI